MVKIAVIRIRGEQGITKDKKDTLDMLRLMKKFTCVVLESTPSILGMIKKVKDYVTYGEIDAETEKLLVEKRQVKENKFFRLSPPVGGFERKGTKVPYTNKGALGDRGADINNLIKKMV